jgi:ribosome production factor 1
MTKKKAPDASLKGKKPLNRAKVDAPKPMSRNPGHIGNKIKRNEMYGKYLQQKKTMKKQQRLTREKEAAALGDDEVVKKQTPKTLDNTRELEATMVKADDEEVEADHADDEFAAYFSDEKRPKILVTTRPRPSKPTFFFIADLQNLIPSLHFYPRKHYSLKEICAFATNRGFTHLMVLSEKSKKCNGMTISHLQQTDGHVTAGPTAFFKVTNVITSQNLPKHGTPTDHIPELNLHGFSTRVGHRVGRFLGSLFPHNAEFQGRQVVTFHNQRDYIFVRHHRYVFYEGKSILKKEEKNPKTRARLQELGPRFTLKMKWMQEGTFDTQFGEYEWFHKRKEMDTTRRRFHL